MFHGKSFQMLISRQVLLRAAAIVPTIMGFSYAESVAEVRRQSYMS